MVSTWLAVNNLFLRTVMTTLMIVSAIVMIISGPAGSGQAPGTIVLAGIIAATVLTVVPSIPDNRMMAEGIMTQSKLDTILHRCMTPNRIRVGLWTLLWPSMDCRFGFEVIR